ncbi:unnamed protein product [Rotaria socialis]|uniref:AAA+ ATPase domain-containing protein n=1 Tax=Rotaria socialis TaxID=392032 RepID=A0A821QFJ7_9BILA|nr:unnamed protein product [Rotaria socialis]
MEPLQKFRFESPTNIMVVGPTSSGKTMLIKDILLHRESMFKQPPSKVVFCYAVEQPFMRDEKFSFIEFVPTLPDIETFNNTDEHTILILDDILHSLKDRTTGDALTKLFMRDMNQIMRLGSQLMPGVKPSFTEIYKWATSEPYSYLLIDLHPSTPADIVLRQNILPDEIETVIYGAESLTASRSAK